MLSFRLTLYNRHQTPVGKSEFEAEDTLSALKVSYRVFESCNDVCAGYALWQGERCISSARSVVGSTHAGLQEFEERIAMDTEAALFDSSSQIRESRLLLDAIGASPHGAHSETDASDRARADNKAEHFERGPLSLSQRERECILLAAKGFKDREIGEMLSLNERTVGEYIERVKRKLDVYTRVEAIVLAVKLNLIRL